MKAIYVMALALLLVACEQQSGEQKVKETTAKVLALDADQRSLAAINAKSYFEREWIQAGNNRGQFVNCRPSDSNFNGMVSCSSTH